ncbi:MAG: type II toxin-antitoxin system Phd/YefM family antitoxin [Cyclobacteriaceae bacterium]
MKTATVTDFRQKMKEHLSAIQNDQDILVLTGPKKMDFVVLTLEAFNAMAETAHLLSTPANTERLMESIAQDKAGKAVVKHLELGDRKQVKRKSKARATAKPALVKRPGK